jgi:hypothetical protein
VPSKCARSAALDVSDTSVFHPTQIRDIQDGRNGCFGCLVSLRTGVFSSCMGLPSAMSVSSTSLFFGRCASVRVSVWFDRTCAPSHFGLNILSIDGDAGRARTRLQTMQQQVESLALHCSTLCARWGLRHSEHSMWEPFYNSDAHFTHSYRCNSSIDNFVRRVNYTLCEDVSQPQSDIIVCAVVAELEKQLPLLITDRTVTAWNNGIYFARLAAFYSYR